jgi:hypothetical protein
MATRPKFVRMANYSCQCVGASHIFLKNGLWRVSASLASPRNTAWRMSASLASPRDTAWQMSASLASPTHFQKRRVSREYSNSLNLPASSHCLEISHRKSVIAFLKVKKEFGFSHLIISTCFPIYLRFTKKIVSSQVTFLFVVVLFAKLIGKASILILLTIIKEKGKVPILFKYKCVTFKILNLSFPIQKKKHRLLLLSGMKSSDLKQV